MSTRKTPCTVYVHFSAVFDDVEMLGLIYNVHFSAVFDDVEMLGLIYNALKEFCFFIFLCLIFASSYIAIDGLEQNAESFLSLFI